MPLPFVPNAINMVNIRLEHGGAAPDSLSEYYGKSNAPSSGTISMNDFRQTGGSPPAATSSGLQCELDARNSSSWSGSGSTWYDTTSNSRDWTLNNGPTGGSSSVVFDGTNDFAQISDASWLPENNGPWTVEFMVKIHDFNHGGFNSNVRHLYSKSSPSNQACSLGFKTTSSTNVNMMAGTEGWGGNVSENTHTYSMGNPSNWVNSWHHFMWTHTGNNGTLTFYIDNSQVAQFTGRTFKDNSAPARLMAFDPTNGNWGCWVDGEIRVARFYNKVLSSSERTANYNNAQSSAQAVAASVLSFSPSSHSGTQFTGTFDFDVDVADFAASDITISGGTKGSLTTVSASQYTMPITPSGNSALTVSVPSSATFNAGNLGNNALSYSVAYSTFSGTSSGLIGLLDASDSSSWPGSGSTWYDTQGSNDATLYNGAYKTSSGGVDFFVFDGTNDYARMNRPVEDDFSIACWFKTTSTSGSSGGGWWSGRGLLDAEAPNFVADFGVSMGGGKIMYGVHDRTIQTDRQWSDGNWHYMMATRNKTTGDMYLYVDGMQAQFSDYNYTNSLTTPSYLDIARIQTGINYHDVDIAEIHLYDNDLSWGQQRKNYLAGDGKYYTLGTFPTSNLHTRMRLDGYSGSGTTWNAQNGSMVGTLSSSTMWSGEYFTFNGSQNISITNAGNSNGTFTLVMWFHLTSDTWHTQTLISANNGTGGMQVRIDGGNQRLQLLKNWVQSAGHFGNDSWEYNRDYCLILTRSGNTYNAYVKGGKWDGSLLGTINYSGTYNRDHNSIGAGYGGERWRGRIYGFAWYTSVLSSSERTAVFNAGPEM